MTVAGTTPASMVEPAETPLPPSSVIAKLDSVDTGVRSTSMTVTTTRVRMAAVLTASTPSSVNAKLDGLEIFVTGLLMNAKVGLVKMEAIVKSFQMDTDVDVQLAQKERTVRTTSMSASLIHAYTETAQMV
jgi:hypothetical protein